MRRATTGPRWNKWEGESERTGQKQLVLVPSAALWSRCQRPHNNRVARFKSIGWQIITAAQRDPAVFYKWMRITVALHKCMTFSMHIHTHTNTSKHIYICTCAHTQEKYDESVKQLLTIFSLQALLENTAKTDTLLIYFLHFPCKYFYSIKMHRIERQNCTCWCSKNCFTNCTVKH